MRACQGTEARNRGRQVVGQRRIVGIAGFGAVLGLLLGLICGAENRPPSADYAQHMTQLKRKVPANGFTVVIQPPFVVIGDGPPEEVRRRARETVQWAVDKLKAAYFEKDPEEILDIWLFRDKESYEKHVQEIFHAKPDTPFGYYSDADRALVMNIGTGGGTLVHEIVHPFVAANFPHCPAWFNEGLGSLYEQSGEVNGRIHGYTNWRLPGLQSAIRKHRVPAFDDFCATSDHAFYEQDRGTNYGQARYLCYYLQQHDLLRKFYRQFLRTGSRIPPATPRSATCWGVRTSRLSRRNGKRGCWS